MTFHLAVEVVRIIRPYLIEKAEIADKIIKFGMKNPRVYKDHKTRIGDVWEPGNRNAF